MKKLVMLLMIICLLISGVSGNEPSEMITFKQTTSAVGSNSGSLPDISGSLPLGGASPTYNLVYEITTDQGGSETINVPYESIGNGAFELVSDYSNPNNPSVPQKLYGQLESDTISRYVPLPDTFEEGSQVSVGDRGYSIKTGNKVEFYGLENGNPSPIDSSSYSIQDGQLVSGVEGIPGSNVIFDTRVLDFPVKISENGNELEYTANGKTQAVPISGSMEINGYNIQSDDSGNTFVKQGEVVHGAIIDGKKIQLIEDSQGTYSVDGQQYYLGSRGESDVNRVSQVVDLLNPLLDEGVKSNLISSVPIDISFENPPSTTISLPTEFHDGKYYIDTRDQDNPKVVYDDGDGYKREIYYEGEAKVIKETIGDDTYTTTTDGDTITQQFNDGALVTKQVSKDGNQIVTKVGNQDILLKPGFLGDSVKALVPVNNIQGIPKGAFIDENGNIYNEKRERLQISSTITKKNKAELEQLEAEAKQKQSELSSEKVKEAKNALAQESAGRLNKVKENFGLESSLQVGTYLTLSFVQQIQDSVGLASLFIGQEEYQRNLLEAQESMEGLYLGKQLESALCEDIRESPLVQSGGIAFVDVMGRGEKIAVTIQGTKLPVSTYTNGTEYLYKITYTVKNGIPEESINAMTWKYNVVLSGTKTTTLWTGNKEVDPGSSQIYTKNTAIAFYSQENYEKLCVKFTEEPLTMETSEVCNTFILEDSSSSSFELPDSANSSSSSSSSSSSPQSQEDIVLNEAEL